MFKKFLLLFPVAALLLGACANDFDVTAPWKEIPVVYAILSPDEPAHFVRVEKAFLDPETSALAVAQIADSLYYPENAITVTLQRVSDGKVSTLQRVDGNLEGHVREGGTFATSPNWLYKLSETPGDPFVRASEKYRLIIHRSDGKPDITSETTIPGEFGFFAPNPADLPPKINFFPDKTTHIEWRSDINALLFDIFLQITYRDVNDATGEVRRDTLLWPMATDERRSELGAPNYRGSVEVPGIEFYQFLNLNRSRIMPAGTETGHSRYFDRFAVIIEGGGREIEAYRQAIDANSGITGAETVPIYTNISEGFGLFTGKNRSSLGNIKLQPETIAAMSEQELTRDLNFK